MGMDASLNDCPVCLGKNIRVHREGPKQSLPSNQLGPSRTEVSHGRILRCEGCGFAYGFCRPSSERLAELYRELDIQAYQAQSEGRQRTASRHLGIVKHYIRTPGRILDVGCASGLFLHYAQKANWEVVGIEPSELLFRKARESLGPQAEIYCGTLESVTKPLTSLDAITLWDVLEHVADPVNFLRICASLLKPGGYLFANVPNLDSIQSRILGSRWPLLLPEHLNYFNRRSLHLCAKKAGLQWVSFRQRPSTFSVDYVLYRLAQHRIPGAALARRLATQSRLQNLLVSVYLGEICSVWRI
jgi:SAM-dependent methyltransferase